MTIFLSKYTNFKDLLNMVVKLLYVLLREETSYTLSFYLGNVP